MNKREDIIEAYKELVIEKHNPKISVIEICEAADTSRKTFYNYFADRYEIIEAILIQDVERPLLKALDLNYKKMDLLELIFNTLLLDRNFYSIVNMEEGQNSFFETLSNSLNKLCLQYDHSIYNRVISGKEKEYIYYKFSIEIAYMIRLWIKNGMVESPEFMAKVCMFPN